MQKIALLLGMVLVAVGASAQVRSTAAREMSHPLTDEAATHLVLDDAKRISHPMLRRAPGELKAFYQRPAGVFYNPLYTRDSKPGTIYGYNSPQLHAPAYIPLTYLNASTGADSYSWSGLHTVGWSKEEVTSTNRDFVIDYPVVLADSVPTLTVTGTAGTASYFLQGYNSDPAVVRSAVWTYPCWQYGSSSTMQERHAWETSKYLALRHPRFDGTASASSYYTMDSQYAAPEGEHAYILGRNTRGYDYAAIAFETPSYPYLITHVGVRYQGLKWTEAAAASGIATITATVYSIDNIPAYSDTQSVTPVLGDVLASGSSSLSATLSPEKDILSIPVYNAVGGSPEISGNILVVVTGYNDDDIADVTLTISNDNEDEGYGELGYLGITHEDESVSFHGLNNMVREGLKSAPSIFIETERPWLALNSGSEAAEHTFDAEGGSYTTELFAYKPMSLWTEREVDAAGNVLGNVPAWVGLSLEQTNSWDQGCTVNATFNVSALPAGTTYREAIIRFAYAGARFDYKVMQGTPASPYEVGDVNGDGNVDIEDVNVLINVILDKANADDYQGRANVDGTGGIDIEDVNAIINLILSN